MSRSFDDTNPKAGNVVPIAAHGASDAAAPLERIFRNKRATLVQYLQLRLGSASDAQDIAQAAFLRLWQRRGQLHDDNLEALLFVTARNIANDLLRSRTRQRNLWQDVSDGAAGEADTVDAPDRILSARHNLALISALLAELPEKCRLAFVRYKFDGREYREIAEEMQVTESMVRKHVLRAVAYCAARFSEMEEWV